MFPPSIAETPEKRYGKKKRIIQRRTWKITYMFDESELKSFVKLCVYSELKHVMAGTKACHSKALKHCTH